MYIILVPKCLNENSTLRACNAAVFNARNYRTAKAATPFETGFAYEIALTLSATPLFLYGPRENHHVCFSPFTDAVSLNVFYLVRISSLRGVFSSFFSFFFCYSSPSFYSSWTLFNYTTPEGWKRALPQQRHDRHAALPFLFYNNNNNTHHTLIANVSRVEISGPRTIRHVLIYKRLRSGGIAHLNQYIILVLYVTSVWNFRKFVFRNPFRRVLRR